VPRARLVRELSAAEGTKLALVSAPAGSGKTTVLAEWHEAPQEPRPFGWLSLDSSDNDTVRFVDGAISALRTVAPGVGEEALSALTGPAGLMDVVLPSLINDVSALGEPVVVVLDDYHLIRNERVHGFVDALVEHLPQTLQLAIATRSQPPLALDRLRARRQLIEVGVDDLRFTDAEATSFLNGLLRLDLGQDDIAQLQARTEGWAAGLQLAACRSRAKTTPGRSSPRSRAMTGRSSTTSDSRCSTASRPRCVTSSFAARSWTA